MAEKNKRTAETCNDCEHFLRMYKGAGVGTCKLGSKKYRSEDAACELTEEVNDTELDNVCSGFNCYGCGDDILENDFSKEHSIGSFDNQGKIVHYYCSECWNLINKEREEIRKHYDID